MTKIKVLTAIRTISAIDMLFKEMFPKPEYSFSKNSENMHFIHEDIVSATEVGDNMTKEVLDKTRSLLSTKYYLRKLIGSFNENSDVSDLLNKSNELKKMNDFFKHSLNKYKEPLFSTANNKFTYGCSKDFLENLKGDIRNNDKEIQNISDKISSLNYENEIELSDEYVLILRNYNLLD